MIEFLIFSSFLHRCHSLSYSPTTIIPKVSEKAETTCCVGLHNTDKLSLHGSKQRSPGHPSEVVLSPDSCKQASLSNLLKLFASHILRELFSLAWSTLYYFSLLSDFLKKNCPPSNSRSYPMFLALPTPKRKWFLKTDHTQLINPFLTSHSPLHCAVSFSSPPPLGMYFSQGNLV